MQKIACSIFGVITYPVARQSGIDFCENILKFRGVIKKLLQQGVAGAGRMINTFLEGVEDGIHRFCNAMGHEICQSNLFPACKCLPGRLLHAVGEWLRDGGLDPAIVTTIPKLVNEFLKTGNLENLATYVLDFIGLSWQSLIGIVAQEFPDQVTKILSAVSFIDKGIEKSKESGGIFAWIKEMVSGASEVKGEVTGALGNLLDQFKSPGKMFGLFTDEFEEEAWRSACKNGSSGMP